MGLATLLEGAGYTFKIFECNYNSLILLWWKVCVKLESNYVQVFMTIQRRNGECFLWTSVYILVKITVFIGRFCLILVRIYSVVSSRVDIRHLSLFLICCLFSFN